MIIINYVLLNFQKFSNRCIKISLIVSKKQIICPFYISNNTLHTDLKLTQ